MIRLISGAVFAKTLRDELKLLIAASLTILLFQAVFVAAMAELAPEAVEFWRRFGFLKQLFKSMFHLDLEDQINMEVLCSVGLAHPMLLTLSCGSLIASCTRVTVGEMEQGTADLLLGLPLPRWRIYVSVTLVWVCTAAALCVASWLGVAAGSQFAELPRPLALSRFAIALANLFFLLVAVGGFVMFVGVVCNRRSTAVGICVGVLIASYLLGFLEAFFDVIRYVRFASLLTYYQPTDLVRSGELPWPTLGNLLILGGGFWLAGLLYYRRRDIRGA